MVLPRKLALMALSLTLNSFAGSFPIKVAVIDTGLDLSDPRFTKYLCESGHMSFVRNESVTDTEGHGTHIAGLIKQYAGESGGYCLLILKYYSVSQSGRENAYKETLAIQWAISHGASFVNISGGGPDRIEEECTSIRMAPDVMFVLAAGNEGLNLDETGNKYYPAMCGSSNISIVGAKKSEYGQVSTLRAGFSNHGTRVTAWELGEDVYSTLPNGGFGTLRGTSQATAIHTGRLVKHSLSQ